MGSSLESCIDEWYVIGKYDLFLHRIMGYYGDFMMHLLHFERGWLIVMRGHENNDG